MSRLRLRTLALCDQTVVSTWGDIDLSTAPLLRAHLSALTAGGGARLVLNLSHTDYLDSTGLAVLTHIHKTLRVGGGELSVIRCRPPVARILHLVGFHHLFTIGERPPRPARPAAPITAQG